MPGCGWIEDSIEGARPICTFVFAGLAVVKAFGVPPYKHVNVNKHMKGCNKHGLCKPHKSTSEHVSVCFSITPLGAVCS
jgi:hypothetical protein